VGGNSSAQDGTAAAVIHTQSIDLGVTAVTQGATIVAPAALGDVAGTGTSFTLAVSDTHLNESVTGVTITGAPAGSPLTLDGVTITHGNVSGTITFTDTNNTVQHIEFHNIEMVKF
jgi:hypothetical protein